MQRAPRLTRSHARRAQVVFPSRDIMVANEGESIMIIFFVVIIPNFWFRFVQFSRLPRLSLLVFPSTTRHPLVGRHTAPSEFQRLWGRVLLGRVLVWGEGGADVHVLVLRLQC